jgi:exopolysaccharide biosynthesis protein
MTLSLFKSTIIAFALAGLQTATAQTAADSQALTAANWEVTEIGKGMRSLQAAFPSLYGGPQYVSIVEKKPSRKAKAGIGTSRQMKPLSTLAKENKATAAINGSYYNMRNGNSVTFLKIDRAVADSTTEAEFKIRVTGAVDVRKGKLRILPWSKSIERGYKKKTGTVLASGPLLLQNSHNADWSACDSNFIEAKHPRSAIAITKDKRVLLITVDGRSPGNAIGMNIPELAHLIKSLGGKTALNLDGGGSTTLYLYVNILNHPCDIKRFYHEGERHIPNMIYYKR